MNPKENQIARVASDWALPIGAISMVFVMLVPLPAIILDLLLAMSITASVLVFLSAIHILKPVQFSVFPTLLLLLTLFRLSLNLASSRRILLHGNEGPAAAGHVIQAFGQFVVGGNYVVGFVLFLALIAIQFLVVSHGSVRTAEVAARFTLDALPGKQMAIDADLNAGLLNEQQARARRQQIAKEAEFYGAMDGAARFNQRDALATILITAINIVAGFLIGVFQLGIPFADALKTYTILTVGDGLVTMIPSLLVSIAGGLVVTRTSSDSSLGSELNQQLLARKKPLFIAAGVLVLLTLVPGLPKLSFLLLGIGLFLFARSRSSEAETEVPAIESAKAEPGKQAPAQESLESLIKLDELSLEVGHGLIALVDEKQGGQMLQRIRALRRHLATHFGFIVPSVHITDSLKLKPREYVVYLRGAEVARWELQQGHLLAISSEPNPPAIPGIDTKEPSFGVPAKWIQPALQEQALAAGYAVVDPASVLATHLAEVIKQHAYELLNRSETKRLLDALSETQPKLVEELVPKVLSLGEVQKVLQQLLREQVSIRDLGTILETLLEIAPVNKNQVLLVESSRQALARTVVKPLLADDGRLRVITLESSLEEELNRTYGATVPQVAGLQPSLLKRVIDSLKNVMGEQVAMVSPVLLCSTPARYHLRRLLEPFIPRVIVVSPGEIPPAINVQSLGVVR